MKLTRQHKWLAVAGVAVLALWLWLRDAQPSAHDIKTMQAFTQNMKTHCVGRFLIDVPSAVSDVSGSYETQIASVEVNSRSAKPALDVLQDLDAELQRRALALRGQTAGWKNEARFLGLTSTGVSGRVLHYLTDDPQPEGVAEGYVARDGGAFLFKTSAFRPEHVTELSNFLAEIEPHLHIRADDGIPKTPGFCINGGLIATNPKRGENVNGWGWTLPGHEDVYFGFSSRTNGDTVERGLVDREATILKEAGAVLMGKIKTIRKARYDIGGMQAQEWSIETTDDAPEYHFDIEIPGKPNDNASPSIGLSMRVGGYGKGGYIKPSLTRGEALALWDAVIRTLRLRPGAM